MSLPLKILYRGSGRVWPSDEAQSERTSGPFQETMTINADGVELDEAINVGLTDFSEHSTFTCEGNWFMDRAAKEVHEPEKKRTRPLSNLADTSFTGRSGEHGEENENFQEVDLTSSSTSRTIVDLKVAVYKTSTVGSSLRNEYFRSTIASDAASVIDGSGGSGTDNTIGGPYVSLDTTQSLQQMHHVTEVVTVDVEVPTVLAPSTGYATRWICPHDKSRFGVAVLGLCYLVIGVIFFPFTLIILMVCCISYFTPGIDD